MEKLILHRNQAANYTIRSELFRGQRHIIVPVIMMVEGVHAGSRGPLLHLAEDLGRFPASWDGIPVVVQHPQENGEFISANSPAVLEAQCVGRVHSTNIQDGKLKAEVWLDEARLGAMSLDALQRIQAKQPIDVSVGVFTEEEEVTNGEWEGIPYIAIARNHRPDHLAILPNEDGACSWADGCGIRVNKNDNNKTNKEGGNDLNDKEKQVAELVVQTLATPEDKNSIKVLKDLGAKGISIIQNNLDGLLDIASRIRMKLDATDDQNNTYFLEELFPDNTLIYRVIVREGEQRTVKLFRTSYIVNGEGNIEFTGTPQQVKKEISYINVNLNLNTKTMERTTKKPCCPDKVNALIAHKETEFTEDHREWLLTQSSEMIESLTPKEEKVIEVNKKVDAPIEAKEVTKEQAINALKDLSADEFMQLMPAEMREQTQHGLNIHQQHKDNMVKAILDNTDKDVWDEKELKAMPIETLSKIAKGLTKEPITEIVDYSANGNSPVVQSEVVEPMFPGGVTEEKKEKE